MRTLQGRITSPLHESESGKIFETFLLNQLRAANAFTRSRGEFFYWRTGSGVEVDCVLELPGQTIGIEIKSSDRWRPEFADGLQALLTGGHINRAFVAYCVISPIRPAVLELSDRSISQSDRSAATHFS